jgi:DNA-binding NtrC family response regulator
MLKEPVAIPIMRGTLEAIATSHPQWKTAEAVWQAFREWSARRGRDMPLSFGDHPPYFHELQHLYEFGPEACPSLGSEGFLRLSGRRFAELLLRDRLPDLLDASLTPGADPPEAIENLFLRFMGRYAGALYRIEATRGRREVSFTVSYADPKATNRYLQEQGLDPVRSFRNSFLVIVAISEAVLEYLLEPWDAKQLTHDERKGVFRIRVSEGTRFGYRRIVGTLTDFARQLQERHSDELFARDLEHALLMRSPLMRETWEKIKLASGTDEILLLRGEPGTGKTWLASRIHEMSARKGRPFVEVCLTADVGAESLVQSHLFGHVRGAFTSANEDRPGLFALSDTGTIFLDEIGDASPDLQAKLLRVIEKRTFRPVGSPRDVTVDVRILAATNRDLEGLVREGRFRPDLYHRLNMIQVRLPPLRERRGEIPVLCDHFLRRLAAELKTPVRGLAPDVAKFLESYDWPGNLRELIHVLKYALLFSKGETIGRSALPETLSRPAAAPPAAPPSAPVSATGEVIDAARLDDLLSRSDSTPVARNATADCRWHIDHAKKVYLRALIRHCRGNLREITSYWDRSSDRTVRSLVKRLGLWDELVAARAARK